MVNLLYVDLFCGAGGTTTGVEESRLAGEKCAKVVACVNHDPNAIASHMANHKDVLHFIEDIRTLDTTELVSHLGRMRTEYPEAKVVLWASLECTNFSRAKGGLPRDADSRTLADHLFRYIEDIDPDFIHIENVEEFMAWGELDENGKPVSSTAGSCYVRWVDKVCGYGYDFGCRVLNSADFGAYTSRRRFFGQFARKGLPIVFPEPTHSKAGGETLFGGMRKWKAVRDVLDMEDEGESIFGRKRPLVEKTLERIYAGLIKFVAGGKVKFDAWMLKYNSTSQKGVHIPPSLDDPCPTVACQNRLGLVKCNFLSKQFGGDPMSKNTSVEKPAGAVTTKETKKGNYRIYKVSEPIMKGISDLFGETTIDKIIESNKDRVTGKFRELMLKRLGKGVEYVAISDAHTHIERLAFPSFDTGEPGELFPHGHPYVTLCCEIEGKHTEMISGGDARAVYPDLVYLRRLAQINGYKWEGEED